MPDTAPRMKDSEKGAAPAKQKDWRDSALSALERVFPGGVSYLKEPRWQRWALIVVTSLAAAFVMAPHLSAVTGLTVGEPAREPIISPITFRVIDEAATAKNREQVLNSVLPVYTFDDESVHDVQERIVAAFSYARDYLDKEAKHRAPHTEPPPAEPSKTAPTKAPGGAFEVLDDNTLRSRFEVRLGARVSPSTFAMIKGAQFNHGVETDLRSLVVPVLLKGVVESRELVMRHGKEGILLFSKSKEQLEHKKDLSTIFDLKEAQNFINLEEQNPTRDTGLSRSIRRIATDLITVNIMYNREKSSALKKEALASVKPVYFQVVKGEPIIKRGEPVNEGHLKILEGLEKANPAYSGYLILSGFALTLIILLRLVSYFWEEHLDRKRHTTADLLLACLLLLLSILLVRVVGAFAPLLGAAGEGIGPRAVFFAAPVATAAMLMAMMINARTAFIFAPVAALAAAMAVEGDIYLFCFYFISGIVGIHGMSRTSDRTSVLRDGLVVGLVNMITILCIKMALGELTRIEEAYQMGLGFLGGLLSGLLVLGLAPLLEPLGYITNVRLLEIANLNHPLLRELAVNAPGTYHHSIVVGNLVEAAAEQIGANPLLARAGAYYHDIGKVGKKTKPWYFIENQRKGENPHDKLEPSMSALILVSHVKDGVEKARRHGLGEPIVEMIQQHHGANLIKIFYNKALAKAGRNHHTVSQDEYRYHGPLPQTKEAALVMLADAVEASSRTLTDPTPSRVQKHVQSVIMGLFSEGQLDQSTLTLKDLHAITRSFVRQLQGILHSRIGYPEERKPQEKGNGDITRQQAEKDRVRHGGPEEEGGTAIKRLGL